jgi:hypothetical protein
MASAMTRTRSVYIGGTLVVATALAVTGCGVLDRTDPEPESPGAPLRTVAADLAGGVTMRASYVADISDVSSATLRGDGDVVAGSAMAVNFTYRPEFLVEDVGELAGELIVVDGDAFLHSPQYDPPPGKEWFSVNRNPAGRLDEAQRAEWYVLALSPLIDPLFLLDQGLPEVDSLTASPTTLDGVAVTEYTGQWFIEIDGAGPELSAWASDVMGASVLDYSLWIDDGGRPVRLRVGSSTQVTLFTMVVDYRDQGAGLAVTAPPEDIVAVD